MAVTLSFGRREGLGLSQTMLFDSLLGRLTVAAFVASNRDKIAKGDCETEFPLRWMQKDMHLASANERQLPSLSKEVAHGHSEVAVINLSDARWLLRKAKSDYKTIIVGMRIERVRRFQWPSKANQKKRRERPYSLENPPGEDFSLV